VLIGVLVNVVTTQTQRVVPSNSTTSASPHLVVDQVSLGYASAKGLDDQLFKVDVKLLNTGTQITAINSVTMTIQDFVALPLCASQGDFDPTGLYRAYLPLDPSPDQVVNVPVSQLVEANSADRFDLLLAAKLPSSGAGRFSVYLYRVHLALTYNVGFPPLDLGEIIVDFPGAPTPGDYFWSKYWAAHPGEFNVMTNSKSQPVRSCGIKNSHALRSFLLKPAERLPDVAAITSELAYK
jgi:hypothetical protein